MKIALIKWKDASYQRGELTKEEMTPLVELTTSGLIVMEDKDTITIAMDYYPVEKVYRHIQHIPKVNVISIRRIESATAKQVRRK